MFEPIKSQIYLCWTSSSSIQVCIGAFRMSKACVLVTIFLCHFVQTPGHNNGGHISRCNKHYFDDQLCSQGSVIRVEQVNYGFLDRGKHRCRFDDIDVQNDCQIPVYGQYLREIEEQCNGRTQCERIKAKMSLQESCHFGFNRWTHYVTIFYKCETTVSTDKRSRSLGLVLGITLPLVVVAVVAVLVSVCCSTKKGRNTKPASAPAQRVSTVSPGDISSLGAFGPEAGSDNPPEYSWVMGLADYTLADKPKLGDFPDEAPPAYSPAATEPGRNIATSPAGPGAGADAPPYTEDATDLVDNPLYQNTLERQ